MGGITGLMGGDTAVDLGTATTRVHVKNRGIVLDEPSMVAVNRATGRIVAVGARAQSMSGRTPDNIITARPLRGGVIADFDLAERMLRAFLHSVHRRRHLARPRMAIAVPTGITMVERRAVEEAGYQVGARKVYIIEKPMAAALGAGLAVAGLTAVMVVDLGGGTTDVAIMAAGGVVVSRSIRVGGDDLTQAVMNLFKRRYGVLLGERMAEEIKITAGSAFPGTATRDHAEVRGRSLGSGLPCVITVPAEELREALAEPLKAIVEAIRAVLDQCPPELAGDLMDDGISLTGRGAQLSGLDRLLEEQTGVAMRPAGDSVGSVVLGAASFLQNLGKYDPMAMGRSDRRVAAWVPATEGRAWLRSV
jgi:rod shape-determining protein MreB